MRNVLLLILTLLSICLLPACKESSAPKDYREQANSPEFLFRAQHLLTKVMVHDIFSPPVVSRIYAYANIAAYEALVPGSAGTYQSLAGQLHGLEPLPVPDPDKEYNFTLAALSAHLKTGKTLIFSEDKFADFERLVYKEMMQTGMPREVHERSIAYGHAVAKHIIAWAEQDNYKQTRTAPKFTVSNESGRWKPTPPAYMDAIEPNWNKIRPFVIDSASQFAPLPPPVFSTKPDSEFYKELMLVYETVKNLSTEQLAIASFWDCNPFAMQLQGHLMFATKKISPGAHWIGIATIAARQTQANAMRTAEIYALTSIALADGFISCWDEKYRSNVIRPETVIQEHIDPAWIPPLQTPPFPEYTSGHSVISNAAATALTHLLGDHFAFSDTVEVPYGLPVRDFSSFRQAADEAAISRLYGGIHYMPAITHGSAQGLKIGELIVRRIVTKDKNLSLKP
jgi:hypothetical protein